MNDRIHNTAHAIATEFGGVKLNKLNRPGLTQYLAKYSIAVGRETDKELLAVYCRLVDNLVSSGADAYECEDCDAPIANVPDDGQCPFCSVTLGGVVESIEKDKLTERDLDKVIEQIQLASVSTAVGYWRIGKELVRLYNDRLYRKRINPETKKPKYANWGLFVKAELPFSVTQARRMMVLAVTFTQETISEIGSIQKLVLIASVPKGQTREDILERVKDGGMPLRMLEGEVRRMFPGERTVLLSQDGEDGVATGTPARGGRTRRIPPGERVPRAAPATPATATAPAVVEEEVEFEPTPQSDRITAVIEPGESEVKLQKKRSGVYVGSEDTLNGIVVDYKFDPKSGVLTVTRRRT